MFVFISTIDGVFITREPRIHHPSMETPMNITSTTSANVESNANMSSTIHDVKTMVTQQATTGAIVNGTTVLLEIGDGSGGAKVEGSLLVMLMAFLFWI